MTLLPPIDLDYLTGRIFGAKIRRKKLVYDKPRIFHRVPELVNRPRVQNVWLGIEKTDIPKIESLYDGL